MCTARLVKKNAKYEPFSRALFTLIESGEDRRSRVWWKY
jgi:hypothetical protein